MTKSILTSLLLFFGTTAFFNQAAGQGSPVVLNESFRQTPLPEVLRTLKEKYLLKLSFEHEAVEGIMISEVLKDIPLEAALDRLFTNTGLDYQLLANDEILIRKARNDSEDQNAVQYFGTVINRHTGEPLPYALITYDPGKGIEADENGRFQLALPKEELPEQLRVQYLGFEAHSIPLSDCTPGESVQIQLSQRKLEIEPVTVIERKPLISHIETDSDNYTFNIDQLNRLPAFAAGKDPLRSLQLLPGINAHDDLSSEPKVRGSNGDENMVILDGIPLYQVGHYFGIFSLINPAVVQDLTVYKNIFPIEYGGRTASVIDIGTHDLLADNQFVNGSAEVNLLTTNAYLEVPLSPNFGFFLGGRITNKNVADTRLFSLLDQNTRPSRLEEEDADGQVLNELIGLDPNFRFHDVHAKFAWQPGEATTLTGSFFSGADQFDYTLSQEFDRPVRPSDTGLFEERARWSNRGFSLLLDHHWSAVSSSEFLLTHSTFNNENDITSSFSRYRPELERFQTISITNTNRNEIKGWELKWRNKWKLPEDQQFDLGIHLVDNQTSTLLKTEHNTILELDNPGRQYALFAQYEKILAEKFRFSLGLRPSYFTPTERVYWSPRINASYQMEENWRWKASWSRYYQFVRQSAHENRLGRTYDFWLLPDGRQIPVASSRQWMGGFTWQNDWFELDVEGYHRQLEGVVEHALVINGFDPDQGGPSQSADYRLFRGSGQNFGIDLMLRKTAGKYTGWLAYTLSKSIQQFPAINDGESFPSPEDRRHQLKWIHQYSWKNWDFSLTYIFSSGQPYTDLSTLVLQARDRRTLDPRNRLTYLEDYHRVDIGVNYRFPLFGAKGEAGFSIFNLLDRRNVKYRQYTYALVPNALPQSSPVRLVGTELQMMGITPNVSLRIGFGE